MRFDTTSWSVILKATVGGSAEARQAMATLCETYWPPVYAFIRRKGHSSADAEDLTQGYFSRFLEKAYVKDFRPEAGRFRTFLCASVQHFLANEMDRERAKKRGGGRALLTLDAEAAEEGGSRVGVQYVANEHFAKIDAEYAGKDLPLQIPGGPTNPLGTRALYLDAPGIRIHGTWDSSSIGTAASHGCIRMHVQDSEELYPLVPIGTQVLVKP